MALDIDNGRRVLLFERHCWALKELNDRAKLAFFSAMLDYGSTGSTDFCESAGIVRTLMPEIVALSETSWRKAKARKDGYKRAMKTEQTRNKRRTNAQQNEPKEEEEEKVSKDTSSVRVIAHRQPTLDEVYQQAEILNWKQYFPDLTVGQMRSALADAHADAVARAWLDANGRPVKNWRTYLVRVALEKIKNFARGADEVRVFKFDPEAL